MCWLRRLRNVAFRELLELVPEVCCLLFDRYVACCATRPLLRADGSACQGQLLLLPALTQAATLPLSALAPQVREALADFHASNYTSCLNHLEKLRCALCCALLRHAVLHAFGHDLLRALATGGQHAGCGILKLRLYVLPVLPATPLPFHQRVCRVFLHLQASVDAGPAPTRPRGSLVPGKGNAAPASAAVAAALAVTYSSTAYPPSDMSAGSLQEGVGYSAMLWQLAVQLSPILKKRVLLPLPQAVRNKALMQYATPFSALDLNAMAAFFNTTAR